LHLADDFASHDRGERRMFSLEKFSKTVEIGESSVRPFDIHRLRQFRNAGEPQD